MLLIGAAGADFLIDEKREDEIVRAETRLANEVAQSRRYAADGAGDEPISSRAEATRTASAEQALDEAVTPILERLYEMAGRCLLRPLCGEPRRTKTELSPYRHQQFVHQIGFCSSSQAWHDRANARRGD